MARQAEFAGTCRCGGKIREILRPRKTPSGELIVGPGIHVVYKCRNCDKRYSVPFPDESGKRYYSARFPGTTKESKKN